MIGAPQLVPLMNTANNRPIGDVMESLLSEAQFQSQNGPQWVLMDGRSITGSLLHSVTGITVATDMRGIMPRAKNNGRIDGNEDPTGERALGSFQADAFEDHRHDVSSGAGHGGFSSGGLFMSTPNSGSNNIITLAAHTAAGVPDAKALAAETRVKNIAVNFFLKVNP